MAIGVEGQYITRFSLGDNSDFIAEDDLIEFSVIEDAGNILPTFQLIFNTYDSGILARLNESNELQVGLGKDRDSLIDISLKVLTLESVGLGSDKKQIAIAGMLNSLNYASSSKLLITDSQSGVETMEAVAGQHFTVDSNVQRSLGQQRWIQHNVSDRKFINDVWLHSDLGNSFPVVGISADSRFIIRDVNRSLAGDFKWRFTKQGTTSKDIIYDDDYGIKISSGFINSWVGYGREKLAYNLEQGTEDFILEKLDPVMALTNQVARDNSVSKKFASVAAVNDNVHENYWNSYQHNLLHLASFGTVRLTFSFQNVFKPIRVLDLVMFRDTDSNLQRQTASFHSGLYFVCKVARSISKRQFVTTVVICRESLNELQSS